MIAWCATAMALSEGSLGRAIRLARLQLAVVILAFPEADAVVAL